MKLNANKRALLGKKSRRLLREGRVPGIVYGHNVEPLPVALDAREFQHVFRSAGRSHLVDLVVDGGRPAKVLIKAVQHHPRRLGPIHVDLQQVSMREKLQVEVPVVLAGEAPAAQRGEADVMQLTHQVRVECLPGDIPEAFEVDVSALADVGDQVRAGELPMGDGVTLLTDPEEVLVKAQPRRERALEEEAAEAAPAAEAAAAVEQAAPAGEASEAEQR